MLESVSGYTNFQVTYLDLARRLQWGATVFDDRSYYVYGATSGQRAAGQQVYRQTGGGAFVQYPLSLYHRVEGAWATSTELRVPGSRRVRARVRESQGQDPVRASSFTGDTTFWRSYGPHAGRR